MCEPEIEHAFQNQAPHEECCKHNDQQHWTATIEESLQIADEGKAKRAAAEVELQKMETELRDTLAAAKSRKTGTGDTIGTAAG